MNNQKLEEQVGKSLWESFRRIASCLTERTSAGAAAMQQSSARSSELVGPAEHRSRKFMRKLEAQGGGPKGTKSATNPTTETS
jgi:hypothetical protein